MDDIVEYRESKYKISSYSEKFYKLNKITKFNLNCSIVLFYTLVLVLCKGALLSPSIMGN